MSIADPPKLSLVLQILAPTVLLLLALRLLTSKAYLLPEFRRLISTGRRRHTIILILLSFTGLIYFIDGTIVLARMEMIPEYETANVADILISVTFFVLAFLGSRSSADDLNPWRSSRFKTFIFLAILFEAASTLLVYSEIAWDGGYGSLQTAQTLTPL
jgi:hypothetical protein